LPRLEFQSIKDLILVGALFLLFRRRREGKKKEKREGKRKKLLWGRRGFPGARPALLPVQQVAVVRCN
jgi:hypothetical protein